MAEIYPLGGNRIFYRPQGFVEGLAVSVDMINPDLELDNQNNGSGKIKLTELIGKGLYYFDYLFSMEGTYIGTFYENGGKRTSQAFSTKRIPAEAEVKIHRGGRGPNVIG